METNKTTELCVIKSQNTDGKEQGMSKLQNYELDKLKAISKKLKACNRANIIAVDLKGRRSSNQQCTIQLSTTAFEYTKTWLCNFSKSESGYVFSEPKFNKDRNGTVTSITHQIYSQNKAKDFLFTINLFLTTSKLLINGIHVETFINDILVKLNNDLEKNSKPIKTQDNLLKEFLHKYLLNSKEEESELNFSKTLSDSCQEEPQSDTDILGLSHSNLSTEENPEIQNSAENLCKEIPSENINITNNTLFDDQLVITNDSNQTSEVKTAKYMDNSCQTIPEKTKKSSSISSQTVQEVAVKTQDMSCQTLPETVSNTQPPRFHSETPYMSNNNEMITLQHTALQNELKFVKLDMQNKILENEIKFLREQLSKSETNITLLRRDLELAAKTSSQQLDIISKITSVSSACAPSIFTKTLTTATAPKKNSDCQTEPFDTAKLNESQVVINKTDILNSNQDISKSVVNTEADDCNQIPNISETVVDSIPNDGKQIPNISETAVDSIPNDGKQIPNIPVQNRFNPLVNEEKVENMAHGKTGYRLIQGPKDILSNFHYTSVRYNGIQYPTAEHAFQHTKAIKLNSQLAEKLRNSTCPFEAKALGKTINDTDGVWASIEKETMNDILEHKANQSLKFTTELIRSDQRVLLHTVLCKKWGIGCKTSDFISLASNYDGKNIFGQLLENLRKKLVTNQIQVTESEKNEEIIKNKTISLKSTEVLVIGNSLVCNKTVNPQGLAPGHIVESLSVEDVCMAKTLTGKLPPNKNGTLSCIVLQLATNEAKKQNSLECFNNYNSLIDSLKLKFPNASILISLAPHRGDHFNSTVVEVNKKLIDHYVNKNSSKVTICFNNSLQNNTHLTTDDVHLTTKGISILCNSIKRSVSKVL